MRPLCKGKTQVSSAAPERACHPLIHATGCRNDEEVPLAKRLRLYCQESLAEAGPRRDMAGVLLGRLLIRADCQLSLHSFMSWAAAQQQCPERIAVFLVPGNLRAVCRVVQRAVGQVRNAFKASVICSRLGCC